MTLELIRGGFRTGGKVVLFSTSLTHASVIPPNYLVYAATKGAVEQLVRVLAKDLGARGINVNTVSPGPIDTDLFRHGKTEQQIAFFENIHPQKRLGQAEEVSNLVQFLVSDDASWVNGQNIRVNGVSHAVQIDLYGHDRSQGICRAMRYEWELGLDYKQSQYSLTHRYRIQTCLHLTGATVNVMQGIE